MACERPYSFLTLVSKNHLFVFRACEALCQCLPDQLKDETFSECLKDDKSTKHWLSMLLKNLENMTPGQQGGANQNMNNAIGGTNKNLAGVKLPGAL